MVRGVLRAIVITLVALAAADPTLTRELAVRQPLTIAATDPDAMIAARSFQRRALDEYDSSLRVVSAAPGAAACPANGGCVLVSTGTTPDRMTAGATVIGALRVPPVTERIMTAVDAPSRVSLSATSILRVRLQRAVRRVEVFDDGVLVGSAASASGLEVSVRWTPMTSGARKLRVVADEDTVDVGVRVDDARVGVLFYAPETTWLGTFVRRALADDTRFDLRGRTEVAPPVAVTRGHVAQLDDRSLAGVAVVVVPAPHLLSARHVTLLERFVARRGGSVLLLLDRRPSGAIVRLLPRIADERRHAQAVEVGPLRTSELLFFEEGPGVTVLERNDGGPVVVSYAIGRGRVIASGATDAWRYRDADGTFEKYWAAITWDAAVAAGDPLRLTAPAVVRTGEEVTVAIEPQTIDGVPADVTAEGTLECGAGRGPLRLWPGVQPGAFTARWRPGAEGRCRIAVSAAGLSGGTEIMVADDIRSLRHDRRRLESAIAAHGGVVVQLGQEDELLSRVRERLPVRREPSATRPMRSPLWTLPLVLCLAAEWWLRRRVGLR